MIVNDKVYSKFEIMSPVVLELIKTKAFQRLKDISQFGVPNKYYHLEGYSRFDHSLGVYIILNKLGASEGEQVAGLLHDISHTAFSHLVDWIMGNSLKEDYQDKRHLSVLKQEEITAILNKYGFSVEDIADYGKFGLLERDIPNLCADRIDYSLRELPLKITEQCLPFLKVFNKEIVFSSEESALLFADNFLRAQMEHWGGYEATTRYVLFSNLLKSAIEDKIISMEDLLETDDLVIEKIFQTKRKKYLEVFNVLENKDLSFLKKSSVCVKKKFRFVDPKILINGSVVKLSEINDNFKKELKMAKKLNKKGVNHGIF